MFRSTDSIFKTTWRPNIPKLSRYTQPPPKSAYSKNGPPQIQDINLWEEIYYQSGHVGVYAAWDPYVEFYMITYNLFLGTPAGYRTFFGDNCVDNVIEELKKIGIELETVLTET